MLAMDAAGGLLAQWSLLPGNDQEGIALKGCELFVAEDVGPEVWVYENFPDASGCHTLFVDTATLSISAGGAQTFSLNAGDAYEMDLYLLLGSASGSRAREPGGCDAESCVPGVRQLSGSGPGQQPRPGDVGAVGRGEFRR